MTNLARITEKRGRMTPNGRERIMQLRAGAAGTGALIGETIYWPWSGPSIDEAHRIMRAIARDAGYEIVKIDPDDEY